MNDRIKEIGILDIEGIKIGQVEDSEAATGCTLMVCEEGMVAGIDIRGGGPASRDSQLLSPLMPTRLIHGVLLGGGSAFGLEASTGVMKCLEERGIGYDVGLTKVPLIVQADIFDLNIGDKNRRPDVAMGYEVAKIAMDSPNYQDGNYGVGCGATVGKIMGMNRCCKSGIGSYAIQIEDVKVGAVVVVNAYGDVFNHKTGEQIAGLVSEDGTRFESTLEQMQSTLRLRENKFIDNTTLGVLITNAKFTKSQLCKIAGMCQNGLARSIKPVHTSADGDTVFALSVGNLITDTDLIGTIGAEVVGEAISRAIKNAKSSHGIPASRDIGQR